MRQKVETECVKGPLIKLPLTSTFLLLLYLFPMSKNEKSAKK